MATRAPTPERLAPERLTIAEWACLPEDESGELVDGRLVEDEVAGFVHELLVSRLIQVLGAWQQTRGGLVVGSDVKLAVGPERGRKADVVVFLPGTPLPPAWGPLYDPPDLVVEVVSPSPRDGRRDRVEKLAEYAGFGIPLYWVVDPIERSLQIFERGPDGRYVVALSASAGQCGTVPGCPGLELDLDAMWAELDRFPDSRDPSWRLAPQPDDDGDSASRP